MHSDELFPSDMGPQAQWEGLEKRINRLLEGIVQLRNANAEIMKENVLLKNQLKDLEGGGESRTAEVQKLQGRYDEALKDLHQVKNNLQRLENLAAELKLEEDGA